MESTLHKHRPAIHSFRTVISQVYLELQNQSVSKSQSNLIDIIADLIWF